MRNTCKTFISDLCFSCFSFMFNKLGKKKKNPQKNRIVLRLQASTGKFLTDDTAMTSVTGNGV